MNFKKIDIENWARKEHYRYYTEKLKNQSKYDSTN